MFSVVKKSKYEHEKLKNVYKVYNEMQFIFNANDD